MNINNNISRKESDSIDLLTSKILNILSKVCAVIVAIIFVPSWLGGHWVDWIVSTGYFCILGYGVASILSVYFLSRLLIYSIPESRKYLEQLTIAISFTVLVTYGALSIALTYPILSFVIVVLTQGYLYYIRMNANKVLTTK